MRKIRTRYHYVRTVIQPAWGEDGATERAFANTSALGGRADGEGTAGTEGWYTLVRE